jgi:hypothetical protein
MEHLKFPIGRFEKPASFNDELRKAWIETISDFPSKLREACENMSDLELSSPYRPNGWTPIQVVHHCADSHMNAFIRFKLALTETDPTIKPYKEDLWAELSESINKNLTPSLAIIDGVHARWTQLLETMSLEDYDKRYFHPEQEAYFTLYEALANYDWHSRHHLAHVLLLKRKC